MSLETIEAKIRGFQIDKLGPYGPITSSRQSIDIALRLLLEIANRTDVVAEAVQADGVILKYRDDISVEIDDDGSILVLDEDNRDYAFSDSEIDQCVEKVESLLCRAA